MANQKTLPIIRTHWSFEKHLKTGEINNEPSETVPDQSMTVQQILERFARGIPLSLGKVPIYEEDEAFYPDPRTLDLSEIEDLRNSNAANLADIKNKLNQKAAEKKLNEDKIRSSNAAKSGDEGQQGSTPKKLPTEGAAGGNQNQNE